jgi:nucleoside-diphosphate-sugar epimerase
MRILLTGATGFIGNAFLRNALARGHTLISLIAPGKAALYLRNAGNNHFVLPGTLEMVPWDDIERLEPETCLHAAWIATPGVYQESLENDRYLALSRTFVTRFLEIGGRHATAIGSCAEYRPGACRLSEDTTPLAPTTRYGICKNELRTKLTELTATRGGSLCWARLFYPFGPGEHQARLCSYLIRQMIAGKPITLTAPKSIRDYIYIDDVAAALLKLIEEQVSGDFNVGTGIGIEIAQIAKEIAELLGAPFTPIACETPSTLNVDQVVADPARLYALGWRPSTSLADGLRRLVTEITTLTIRS